MIAESRFEGFDLEMKRCHVGKRQAHHGVWGLEAVKTGVFAPPPPVGAMPFADLRAMVGQAVTALEAFTPDEVNSWSGKNLDIDL